MGIAQEVNPILFEFFRAAPIDEWVCVDKHGHAFRDQGAAFDMFVGKAFEPGYISNFDYGRDMKIPARMGPKKFVMITKDIEGLK